MLSVGVCVVAAMATAGCQGTPAADSPGAGTTTEAPAAADPAEPEAAQEAAQEWAMPDVVGMVLQDAQDQLQSLTGGGVLYTASHDLSGENRNQVLDANWQVCTQNIAPGAPITSVSRIDFGAVKIDENCP